MSFTTSHDDIVRVIGNDDCINVYAYAIDACNYSCAYCYNETANHRTGQKLNFNALLSYLTILYSISKKHICLSIIGGEPTLHNSLLRFCKQIHDSYQFISIELFSNFSASLSTYKVLMEYGVLLKLSYHSQNTQYFSKLDELCKSSMHKDLFSAIVMYEPQITDFIIEKCYQYKNVYDICLSKINSTINYNVSYSSDDILAFNACTGSISTESKKNIECVTSDGKIVNMTYDQILKCRHNSFIHWLCSAGIRCQYVHVNGNISQCHAAFHANHIIGNISQSKVQTQCMLSALRPKLCAYSTCNCEVDISKQKVFR